MIKAGREHGASVPLFRDALRSFLGTDQLLDGTSRLLVKAGRLLDAADEAHTSATLTATDLRGRLTYLGIRMSELDTSTDALTTAVTDLLDAYDPTEVQGLLQQIAEKNTEIEELRANDDADAQAIADRTAERDALLADVTENVGKQVDLTARVRAVVPAPAAPVEEPTPEPAPEPVTEPGNPVAQEETGSSDETRTV